jgi:hypothetical protein
MSKTHLKQSVEGETPPISTSKISEPVSTMRIRLSSKMGFKTLNKEEGRR